MTPEPELDTPTTEEDERFSRTITISLMDLYNQVRGELNFTDFGDPDGREDFAGDLVRKLVRDWPTVQHVPGMDDPVDQHPGLHSTRQRFDRVDATLAGIKATVDTTLAGLQDVRYTLNDLAAAPVQGDPQ